MKKNESCAANQMFDVAAVDQWNKNGFFSLTDPAWRWPVRVHAAEQGVRQHALYADPVPQDVPATTHPVRR